MLSINNFVFILFTFLLTYLCKTAISAPILTSNSIETNLQHVRRMEQSDIATILVGPASSQPHSPQVNPQRPNQHTKQFVEQPNKQSLQQSNPITTINQQPQQNPPTTPPTENNSQPSSPTATPNKPQESITTNNEKGKPTTTPTASSETLSNKNTKSTTENDPPLDNANVNTNKAETNSTDSSISTADSEAANSTDDDESENKMSLLLVAIGGSGAGLIVIISIVTCFCCARIRKSKQMSSETLKAAEIRQDPEVGNNYVPPAPEMRKYVMDDRRDSTPWGHPPEALIPTVVEPEVNRASRSGLRIPSLRSQS